MASIAANANPDASQWPFVTMRGYEEITQNLIETSSGREMGFAPLVTPEQLADFEDFAYNYYFNVREPPFPTNTTAQSSFGRGVWGFNPALNTSDNRYHESDGSTSYDSPNKIFAPILHHNEGPHKALMLNLHFQKTRGVIIDNMIACAQNRKESATIDMECGAITDFLILTSQEFRPGPGALMMQPIYAAASPYEVGIFKFVVFFADYSLLYTPTKSYIWLLLLLLSLDTARWSFGIVNWDEVLTDIFAASVSGVDCVIKTPEGEHTYRITEGDVTHV